MDMGGGGMGMDDHACKISMLWNWYTVDACFVSKAWHVRSHGAFAGSCIGVILLVMLLEGLRRATKEYDRYIIKQHRSLHQTDKSSLSSGSRSDEKKFVDAECPPAAQLPPFRPHVGQQAIRAFLHMSQFAVAYIIMLLAMYYNGYIIISIFIGAYLGAFVFQWETLADANLSTSAAAEATVCCG